MVHAYAESRRRPSPAGLTAALGLSGVMVGALFFAAPAIETITYIPLVGSSVPEDVPPPPADDPPPPAARPTTDPVVTPDPVVPVPTIDRAPVIEPVRDPSPFPITGGVDAGGGGSAIVEPATPAPPVLTAAEIDPRYAGDFQPDYPSAMIRREIEARVIVRVLVGRDGRVKAIEPVNAVDPAFVAATRRHALARWRFRPATRDGVAVEQWRQMAVRFELNR